MTAKYRRLSRHEKVKKTDRIIYSGGKLGGKPDQGAIGLTVAESGYNGIARRKTKT